MKVLQQAMEMAPLPGAPHRHKHKAGPPAAAP
jgi:hypothetical protein